MGYKYEIVKAGATPTWDKANLQSFKNPVGVGHKVKPIGKGTDLVTIVEIEHYENCSVLYHK